MLPPEILKSLVKYLNNQASQMELNQLESWISNSANEESFKSYVKLNYCIDFNMKNFNKELSKKRILETIEKDNKIIRINRYKKITSYAAAAIVVGFLILTGVFNKDRLNPENSSINEPVITNNNITPASNKATLIVEDGTIITLDEGIIFNNKTVTSNGDEIIYKTSGAEKRSEEVIASNILTVPRGGQFQVVLADGTKIWLNSETQITYPVEFIKNKPRIVELLYGEAYFEVSPSTKNNGSEFKVLTNGQEVEVLGTKFNIKAYKDEINTYTALVEGKIAVKTSESQKILEPNQQSRVNNNSDNIKISTINASTEIAWINGNFVVNNKNLKEIMQVLSRWYDMDVEFETKELEKVQFRGVIRKDQDITDILNTIKESGILTNYEIHNKTVILK